ncbi:uncharacterized protein LY89DRAFT_785737 [Mollisia scopiformis]|uniref:Uncharacterized protein n=1 Tax=Mollisia scopiformis TaxID=149040 RepID=A0A194WWN9_MOLSC|nr:uncharacterized protein LY89DRAFT_785737 [Mollisia scopiformis]KUJ12360.1 hypothetical protein LY89DRAFT_785737 [Mollisia scopiformis]
MGFYGLMPADKLSAVYNSKTKILTLTGSGKHAQESTTSIGFTQQTLYGGMLFDFGGWTGPLIDPPTYFDYTRSSHIPMVLPNPAYPTNGLTIKTSNHPEGISVEIVFKGTPDEAAPAPAATSGTDEPGHTVQYGPFAAYDSLPFAVTQVISGPVFIKYDETLLNLKSAMVANTPHPPGVRVPETTSIIWTFVPIVNSGKTEVVVTYEVGSETVVAVWSYDIYKP